MSDAAGEGTSRGALADTPIILIPVFNDWVALGALLPALDRSLQEASRPARVLVLDDRSTDPARAAPAIGPFQAIREVRILELRRNLGHQRAIAVGLAFVDATARDFERSSSWTATARTTPPTSRGSSNATTPEGGAKIVFAERTQAVGVAGRSGCSTPLYRALHVVLTGTSRAGRQLQRDPAAAAREPRRRLRAVEPLRGRGVQVAPAVRDRSRPRGPSGSTAGRTMNFVSLVIHGLSAISVYSEVVGVRAARRPRGAASASRPDRHRRDAWPSGSSPTRPSPAGRRASAGPAGRLCSRRSCSRSIFSFITLGEPPRLHVPAAARLSVFRRPGSSMSTPQAPEFTYIGDELELFAAATTGSRTSATRSARTSEARSSRSGRGSAGRPSLLRDGSRPAGSAWSPTPRSRRG